MLLYFTTYGVSSTRNGNTLQSARKLPQEVTIGSKTGTGALAALDGTCPLDIEK